MTRKVKTETTTVKKRTYYRFCDLCGSECDAANGWYDHSLVTIRADLGEIYPEGDDCRDRYETDVCPRCFLEKVKPALEAIGSKFVKSDTEDPSYEVEEIAE